mgnify:CR=1 FL=1
MTAMLYDLLKQFIISKISVFFGLVGIITMVIINRIMELTELEISLLTTFRVDNILDGLVLGCLLANRFKINIENYIIANTIEMFILTRSIIKILGDSTKIKYNIIVSALLFYLSSIITYNFVNSYEKYHIDYFTVGVGIGNILLFIKDILYK